MMNQYLVSLLEQKLKDDPSSRVFLRLAEELRKGERYQRAVEVCVNGLTYHSDYVPALVCLGRCQRNLGLDDEAEKIFRQVLSITPDNPHALRGLGEILFHDRRYAEALEIFETLSLHEPGEEHVEEMIRQIQTKLVDPGIDEPIRTGSPPAADVPPHRGDDDVNLSGSPVPVPENEEAVTAGDRPFNKIGESGRDVDDIDLEFERAIHEADRRDALLFKAEDLPLTEPAVPLAKAAASDKLESRLTLGLKHEKMEHFEEARTIYRSLLPHYRKPVQVREHLERVNHRIENETRTGKKIRILSNWLDKIKGVYHVS